jgi:hypothetical protein
MAAVEPYGSELYWLNGHPYEGVRLEASVPGNEKFWVEGSPAPDQPPPTNADTGKMFLEFE